MAENWAYVANLGFRSGSVYAFGGYSLIDPSNVTFSWVSEVTLGWNVVLRQPSGAVSAGFSCGDKVDGKGIIVGGTNGSSAISKNSRYTPATAQGGAELWEARTEVPTNLERAAAASIELVGIKYLYVTGGGVTGSIQVPIDNVRHFRDDTNTWTSREPMLTTKKHHGAAASATKVYVACGQNEQALTAGFLNSIEEYTHGTDTWAALTSDPGFGGRTGIGWSGYSVGQS